MAARIRPIPVKQLFTDSGTILNGGLIYTYSPGTTTDKATYQDSAKAVEHTNPIVLDAYGRYPSEVFWDGMYDVVVKTSAEATIETISNFGDNWSAVGTDLNENLVSNHSFETAGTGGEPFANWTETDSGTVITRDTSDQYHGVASALFTLSQNGSDYITSDAFELGPSKTLKFSFDVKANHASAQPQLKINWLDSAQASISTTTVYNDDVGLTPTSWTHKYGYSAAPPSTARYGKLIVVGNNHATQYTTNFDNISVVGETAFPSGAPYTPYGLVISRDAGDTSHDLNITAGAVKDATFAFDMILPSEITKQADATFAEGDDAGGAESGFSLPASGISYVWLIMDSDSGHVDVLISASATAPTMPSGYDRKRLIGAWITDASNNFIGGVHRGTIFEFYAQTEDVDDTTLTTATFETATATAPPHSILSGGFFFTTPTNDVWQDGFVNLRPVGSANTTQGYGFDHITTGAIDDFRSLFNILLDASSQYEYAATWTDSSDVKLTLYTIGFNMLTRDNP